MATLDGVVIADDAEAFVAACEAALALARDGRRAGCDEVDAALAEHVVGPTPSRRCAR